MAKFSRDKGKRAEREVIDQLQPAVDRTYSLLRMQFKEWRNVDIGETPKLQRNTLQSDDGGCDIAGMEWLALEVKHHETLAIPEWWRQTVRQAKRGQLPVLAYRRNGTPWRVRMPYDLQAAPTQQQTCLCIVEISMEDFVSYFEHKLYFEAGNTLARELL